jgi:hypothetical protein
MFKHEFNYKGMFKRIFAWVRCQKYRESRRISDHRATSLAVKLTLTGALMPHRAIPSITRSK